MRKLKSIFLLMLMAIVPLQSFAAEEESKELDIPEIVLEHLADAYAARIPGSGISVRLTVFPRASTSTRSTTERYMRRCPTAQRYVHST